MIGILTEKPSQKNNFVKAFGAVSGTYNGEQYVISNAIGHLFEMAKPDQQVRPELVARYKSWDIAKLPWNERDFVWKKELVTGKGAQLQAIRQAFAKCDELVYAGDFDASGEGFMISYEIFSALGLRPKKWSRMYYSDEANPKDVLNAFATRKIIPVPEQDREYMMSNYRGCWDFMSMQWTRVATACGDGKAVLRQGRLKSAMVLLVGDQLAAVKAYKKIPSYQNRFRDENGVVYTDPDEPQYKTEAEVPKNYHASDVVVDSKAMKSTAPPKLMDLAALSAKLSTKGLTAKIVLDTYQHMYEAGVVSYPRTDDKTITPDQFTQLLGIADRIAKVVGVDAALLTNRKPRSTHVKPGGVHGANRPGMTVPASLAGLDQKYGPGAEDIYEQLARNFLALLAPDYEYESQKGHVKDYPKFVGTCAVPKKQGWKAVFGADDVDPDAPSAGLGTRAESFVHEGFPPRPATPTMKWLMERLEDRDVGTGATRTSTYGDVTNAQTKFPLMKDKRGKIELTTYGDMSYRLLPGTNIGSLDMTERVQVEMRDVADGKRDFYECLSDIQRMVREDVAVMTANGEKMRKEMGVSMQATNPADYCEGMWNGKDIQFKKSWSGHDFTDDECQRLLAGEEIEIEATGKSGKPFKCKGKLSIQTYNGHKYVGFENTGFVNDGNAPAASDRCSGTWNGRDVSFKKSWSGHDFTDEECEKLLAGEEIEIEATGKSGKPFKCRGHLEEQSYNGRKYVGFKNLGFVNDGASGGGAKAPAADRWSGTWNGESVSFKREWSGHKFTDKECKDLCAGKEIEIEATGKSGKPFKCKGHLERQEFNGRQYVGFKNLGFVDDGGKSGPPAKFLGHMFTKDEMDVLSTGMALQVSGLKGKSGKEFNAKIHWGTDPDSGGMKIIIDEYI